MQVHGTRFRVAKAVFSPFLKGMLRVYCNEWDGGETFPELDREEVHHLVRVRRVRAGEEVEVLNGKGAVGLAEVISAESSNLQLRFREVRLAPENPLKVHLLVALPKGKTFPALLQKVVELGVSRITPLVSENVEVPPERAEKKQDRWESVLVEALKQSGNPWMPQLDAPTGLAEAIASPGGGERICAALQPDTMPLWQLLHDSIKPSGSIEVFIGPEGDFSVEEYNRLRAAGCYFVSLGPLVLRVETAASLLLGTLRLWSLAS